MGFFTWLLGLKNEPEVARPPIHRKTKILFALKAMEEVRASAKFSLARADKLFQILLQHRERMVGEVMDSYRGNDILLNRA